MSIIQWIRKEGIVVVSAHGDKVGIAVNGDDQVVVRGNTLENLGGDGIVIIGADKALIEYNIADKTCMRSGDLDLAAISTKF